MKKKDFPIIVLETLAQIRQEVSENIKLIPDDSTLVKFVDKDEDSTFYFSIVNFDQNKGIFTWSIKRKPRNEANVEEISESLIGKELFESIKNWERLIKKYDGIEYFKDDSFLNTYATEFYEEYKILENDAHFKPFDIKRQKLIDQYLTKLILIVEDIEIENPSMDFSDLKRQANELIQKQTSLSKNETIKALAKLWAFARIKGFPVIKKIFYDLGINLLANIGSTALLGT
jgi:hypothetical protein